MNELPSVDRLTEVVLKSGSKEIVRGFAGAATSVFIFAVRPWVPGPWQPFLQWPLYAVFLLSLGVLGRGIVRG